MTERRQSAPGRRAYHSPTRQRQAAETRRRILDAARTRFRAEGYAGATLEGIAAAAAVSPKTVEAAFGSKRGLLAALVDPLAPEAGAQDLISLLRDDADPRRRLGLAAQLTRRAYEVSSPEFELMRGAGAVAPELAEAARQVEARRRQRQEGLITYLHDRGVLRADLAPAEATDLLWALTGYDLYRALVVERGWHPDRYEAWLAPLLLEHLLGTAERDTRTSSSHP
jgi:AcrR family transcriptional regulator